MKLKMDWADAIAESGTIYAAMHIYLEQKRRLREQEADGRHFVAARIVKHMDIALASWEETHSQEAMLEAWAAAFEPEFEPEKMKGVFGDQDVLRFAQHVAAQIVHTYIPSVWDRLREPGV